MRKRNVDRIERADEVGVDDVDPRLQRRFTFHARDAGLRHDDVEMAELCDALLERGAQLRGLTHVGLRGESAAPRLLDECRGLLEVLRRRHRVTDRRDVLTEVDSDDVGAFLGQPDRVTPALPARGAGDERDLSLYSSH